MTSAAAIRRYFTLDCVSGSASTKHSMTEMKELMVDKASFHELGKLACVELGEDWTPTPGTVN